MSSSEYWKLQQNIKRLQFEKDVQAREIEALRQRDVLREEVKRQKKEKFYRSPLGRALTSTSRGVKETSSAFKAFEEKQSREWSSPKTKKQRKELGKSLKKLYGQILGD